MSGAAGGGAFVAGATGYVGRELVRQLAGGGVPTVAHVRPDSPRLAEWRARFEAFGAAVDATPWDEEAMTATLAALRPATVFALLGTTRARGRAAARRGGGAESYETVDYALTMRLVRAAAAAARAGGTAPRVVYLSAIGARADARNPYVAVRGRVERELGASGLPFTIVRPSFVTGPDREESRPAERLGARVLDALLAIPGALGARRLRDRWRSTTAAELAAALARVAADPDAAGRVLHGEALRAAGADASTGAARTPPAPTAFPPRARPPRP